MPSGNQKKTESAENPVTLIAASLKALGSGFATTAKHLLRKPITEQYPEEKRVLPGRSRARIVLTRDPDGQEPGGDLPSSNKIKILRSYLKKIRKEKEGKDDIR